MPRSMKYPYTFAAKIKQFPMRHYIQNQWIWRYYFLSVFLCIPVFYKISRLANSKANKEKWAAAKAKEKEEHEEHH